VQSPARLILCALAACVVLCVPASAGAAVYLSPSGSDSAACSAAAPCKSFDRGYRVAAPGDEVILAGGTYGGQTLKGLPDKGAKVTFHPAAGAAVHTGYLMIDGSRNIEVRDLQADGWGVQGGAAHVVLRNISVFDRSDGGFFGGADDVQVIGGEIGRIDPNDGIHFNNAYGTNTNITIDGLFMHDLTRDKDPSSHDDCIQTGDVTNLVIRNSRFVNCGTQGIFLNPYNNGATKNITIESTWFGPPQLGYNSLYVGDAVNVLVRNNSFDASLYVSPTSSGVSFVNNILGKVDGNTCSTAVSASSTFDNNMTASSCSGATHNVVNSGLLSQYVNSATSPSSAMDLHLKPGAMAIDRGSAASFAATDIDGQARPIGGAPDIGADEWGATPPGSPAPPAGGGTTPAPTTPGTTPASPSSGSAARAGTAAALAAIAAVLPASTASAFRKLDTVRQATKRPLVAAGVKDSKICKFKRRSCPRSTLLRIAATGTFKGALTMRRVLAGNRYQTVRRMRIRLHRGTTSVRIRVGRLAKGEYQLAVRAPNGARVSVPLTVG
jgi:hypothetical protein